MPPQSSPSVRPAAGRGVVTPAGVAARVATPPHVATEVGPRPSAQAPAPSAPPTSSSGQMEGSAHRKEVHGSHSRRSPSEPSRRYAASAGADRAVCAAAPRPPQPRCLSRRGSAGPGNSCGHHTPQPTSRDRLYGEVHGRPPAAKTSGPRHVRKTGAARRGPPAPRPRGPYGGRLSAESCARRGACSPQARLGQTAHSCRLRLSPSAAPRRLKNLRPKRHVGWTDLHSAALVGDAEEVEELLEEGADPNAKAEGGLTPLHVAAYKGRVDVAKLLQERGADPTVKNKDGDTPLDLARRRGHRGVLPSSRGFTWRGGWGAEGSRLGRARRPCGLRRTPSARPAARPGASSARSTAM